METRFEVSTRRGPLWLWGRDTGRPVLLVISGAFASDDFLVRSQIVHPDVDVLRTHLPGNHCPVLDEVSMRAYVDAYDEALGILCAGRVITVLGASVGGVLGLGLRCASIGSRVIIEPPLLAAGLWPLHPLREQAPAGSGAFLLNILGIGPDDEQPVDHSWVLDGLDGAVTVLLGSDPSYPPREVDRVPSLVVPAARMRLERHSAITVQVAEGAGHNVPRDAPDVMHRAILRALSLDAARG